MEWPTSEHLCVQDGISASIPLIKDVRTGCEKRERSCRITIVSPPQLPRGRATVCGRPTCKSVPHEALTGGSLKEIFE